MTISRKLEESKGYEIYFNCLALNIPILRWLCINSSYDRTFVPPFRAIYKFIVYIRAHYSVCILRLTFPSGTATVNGEHLISTSQRAASISAT